MKKWKILSKLKGGSAKLKNQDIIKILLKNRGLKTKKEIASFLNPDLSDITIDSVGLNKKEVNKTIDKIKSAIEKKDQIVIYGDYDVDGITATAILWETLFFDLKAKVTPYIPNRIDEGYGLSVKGIDNLLIKFPETKLIITVDNGIVANEAVDYAFKKGIETLITDHHVKSEVIPNAFSIVHTTSVCGAGIAYILAKEIMRQCLPTQESIDNHLELATLGTIADLVPLKDANRVLVKFGLKKLSTTKRPGLLELYNESGIDKSNIGVYEVGHYIAPRLNATGRMESAMDSLRLLCTKDVNRAHDLASLLGTVNRQRQNVMIEAVKHASLSVKQKSTLRKLLIVSHETYPEGVIGLVAGRLVEEFYRPAIVISKGTRISKGSVRSIHGFNIIEFLRQSQEHFINIGGHPMAAGFTIETDKLDKMQKALENLSEDFDDDLFKRIIKIDLELPYSMISQRLYDEIQKLAPFGMSNMEPVFMSRNVKISEMRVIGKEKNHLKMTLTKDDINLDAICFGMGGIYSDYTLGENIDIVFAIDENVWNDNRKLQLKIKDIKKSEAIA